MRLQIRFHDGTVVVLRENAIIFQRKKLNGKRRHHICYHSPDGKLVRKPVKEIYSITVQREFPLTLEADQ